MADVPIRLVAGSEQRGFCRGCRQPILWVTTLTKRLMPMNGDAQPKRVEDGVAIYAASDAHWATCPNRDQFKRDPIRRKYEP